MPSPPSVRVIIRLPYNRPEDAPADPPRIEWSADKEHILWEVIAKSRAVDGATDWKGLAQHLQVPLPYLLYRAQVRYEEDLRGLQGLGGPGLAVRSPATASPSAPSPIRANGPTPGEYFPRITPTSTNNPDQPQRPSLPHRESARARLASSSSQNGVGTAAGGTASTSGTVPGTSTLRPNIGVRARLSSLGHAHGRALQLRSPITGEHVQSPLSTNPTSGLPYQRPTKKVSSSSTLTLQGPKRTRSPLLHPLSPASSRAGSSSDGANGGEDTSDEEDESDEEARKEEEAEKQDALARKLAALEKLMTKDALGLVAEPVARLVVNGSINGSVGGRHRGRVRPLSRTSASLSSSGVAQDFPRERNQSLSSASVDSPHGSIPDIPSPQAQSRNQYAYQYPTASTSIHSVRNHQRHHSQGYIAYQSASSSVHHNPPRSASHSQSLSSHSQSLSQSRSNSHSDPHSPHRVTSPMPVGRHISTPEKSSSPPALSPGSARGHTAHARGIHAGLAAGTPSGSEASSFSDLSDASVSQSALESALMSNVSNMSNVRSGGSRLSSFARSRLQGNRRSSRS
ncbi:hypothetical protein BD311DRAFT_767446 [Dichomitus squalens]|uniref:Autophagy-related protein 29 n=1 Tax=Dichomitus squalens TaxID=114155 RepID=A0A4Q9MA07_9APHY|nr:hypothetical protein BD311DRAFT_767446 [Dichomitus squalens]